jgi:signal transduction histidine kinase
LLHRQVASDLHQFLVQSGIALSIMMVVAIVLGWVVAGRVLRPLRTMTATTREISEQNLHQRLALHGPADELTELGDTIDGLLARLEGAFIAQRRFVANAAHELRTPLTMMRTSLDVAAGKPEPIPPEIFLLAGKVREGLNQADQLVESFLVLAYAQQGAMRERTRVELSHLVTAALAARHEAMSGNDLMVHHTLGDAAVIGNATLLSRLVDNLLDNASRYNVPQGTISVIIEADGTHAHLVMENSAPLLEERAVQALGQPFQRLGADRTGPVQGVGLGLSIVAAIVAAHGGELRLHARAEGGLQVCVTLPQAGPPMEQED